MSSEYVKNIFQELKNEGFIDKVRELKVDKGFAGNDNILKYPIWAEEKKPSENLIRFCLLHEEAHKTKFQEVNFYNTILQFLMVSFPISLISFSLILSLFDTRFLIFIVPSILFLIILIFITALFMRKMLKKTELNCDKWAWSILEDHYNQEEPSRLIEEYEEIKNEVVKEQSWIKTKMSKIPKFIFKPHPSWEKRKLNLKNLSKKSVSDIFEELKRDGIISPSRKLKKGKKFESSLFRANLIYYTDLANEKFEEDLIKFILLHEESHLTNNKEHSIFARLSLIFLIMIYLASFFTNLINIWHFFISIGILFMILIILVHAPVLDLLKKSEYKCDFWAAKILKNEYDISEPSLTLNKLKRFKMKNGRSVISLIRGIIDPHPSIDLRIKRIENLVDDT